jgi:hypothetical protein
VRALGHLILLRLAVPVTSYIQSDRKIVFHPCSAFKGR